MAKPETTAAGKPADRSKAKRKTITAQTGGVVIETPKATEQKESK